MIPFFKRSTLPRHIVHGRLGEKVARKFLVRQGMKFITANFKSRRKGEIDLIFKEDDCLVFVEVKTRSATSWTRPAAAVDKNKRRLLSRTAFDYIKQLGHPPIKFRFDIMEVILESGKVQDIRHLPNAFPLTTPYRYG